MGQKVERNISLEAKESQGKNFMEAKEGWGKIQLHQNAHTLLQKEVALLTGKLLLLCSIFISPHTQNVLTMHPQKLD